MGRHAVRQLLLGAAQLVVVAFLIFVLINASPGDPAMNIAGESASQEQVEQVREELGLNDPVYVQFFDWFQDAVRGDLGESLVSGEPVTDMLKRTVPPTLSMIVVAMFIAIGVALVVGSAAALRPQGVFDRIVTVLASVGVAIPGFFVALILVMWFAVERPWFPAVGYVPLLEDPLEWLHHIILPAIALATVSIAEVTRQLRGSLVDVLDTDYVLAARGRGIPTKTLVYRHSLKNAAVPVMTVLGVRLSQMIAGTVIIETIFNISGIGNTVVRAAINGDIPVVLGVTMLTTIFVLITNVAIDLIHPLLNPKVRTA